MTERASLQQEMSIGIAVQPPGRKTRGWLFWRAFTKSTTGVLGFVGLLTMVLLALLAAWISPYDPTQLDYDHLLSEPGPVHWWGTDDLGRDVMSRVLWGGRESLRVSIAAILLALAAGVTLGLISGYYGGWLDLLMQRLVEIFQAFPTVLLLLSIVALLGPNLGTALIALGISAIPGYTRLVRGSVLSAKHLEYVTAARVIGAGDARIMLRHILPNIVAPVIVYSTVGLGAAIIATAGLSYIGLGAQPPSPEWGAMLSYGRRFLRDGWWMSVFPGIAIFISVLCTNLLGDGLRDALDPRLRFQ